MVLFEPAVERVRVKAAMLGYGSRQHEHRGLIRRDVLFDVVADGCGGFASSRCRVASVCCLVA